MSAYQFHRMTATFYGEKVSYRTAWFMFHRIRFAMTQHPMIEKLRGVVEVDETYIGGKEKGRPGIPNPAFSKKRPVLALVGHPVSLYPLSFTEAVTGLAQVQIPEPEKLKSTPKKRK